MEDSYPFDREYTLVNINFPVCWLRQKANLLSQIESLAQRRGGVSAGSSEPAREFLGKPGFETFGIAVAFENGDANIDGFISMVQSDLKDYGVQISWDPSQVYGPDPDQFNYMGARP